MSAARATSGRRGWSRVTARKPSPDSFGRVEDKVADERQRAAREELRPRDCFDKPIDPMPLGVSVQRFLHEGTFAWKD